MGKMILPTANDTACGVGKNIYYIHGRCIVKKIVLSSIKNYVLLGSTRIW